METLKLRCPECGSENIRIATIKKEEPIQDTWHVKCLACWKSGKVWQFKLREQKYGGFITWKRR